MELWNKKHPFRSAINVLLFMFFPAVQLLWGFFTNQPMFPTIAKWVGGVDVPDISITWLLFVTIPFGIVMLFLIHRETKKPKYIETTQENPPDNTLEERVVVRINYQTNPVNPRRPSPITIIDYEFSWGELFDLISPYISMLIGENTVKRQLARSILTNKGVNRFYNEKIDDNIMQKIREKFLALNLIMVIDGKDAEGLPLWYWCIKKKD